MGAGGGRLLGANGILAEYQAMRTRQPSSRSTRMRHAPTDTLVLGQEITGIAAFSVISAQKGDNATTGRGYHWRSWASRR